MYAICRCNNPRELRRYGGSQTPVLFFLREDAEDWIAARPEMVGLWRARPLTQDDWKHKKNLTRDIQEVR